jgi:outer membrane protein OmpA-like peptidoglycan-associated protein
MGLGLLIGVLTVSLAGQSTDPKHPTPLGPGVNKGNVENFVGPHYYSFAAGPGHIDVKFAFKEMGIFGNPLRQGLSFDFKNEDGSMASHNAVVSQGKIERLTTTGDLPKRQKFILVITAQNGAVRMGGYYEVEITGAVSFDGKTVGEGTKAHASDPLVHPGGPLVTPGGPLVTPGGPLVHPGGPLVTPAGPLVKPGQALVISETPRETKLTLAADVLFDFDSAVVRADAKPELHRVADLLRQKARGLVLIEGHTDSKGTPPRNMTLSQQRAAAIRAWLVANEKLPQGMFNVQGFGASRPVAANAKPDGSDDPAGRQRNRRVELIIAK